MSETPFRFGIVAMVGRPNAGKSTILNAIVGQRVSIVSSKPQTTRRPATGIANGPGYQIAFVDTPGIHEPHTKLGRAMVESARKALTDVDLVLVVVDSSKSPDEEDRRLAKALDAASPKTPRLLCLNKMDQLKAEHVVQRTEEYSKLYKTDVSMLTTATRNLNLDKLVELVVERLPEGVAQYPEDEFTDQPSRFMVSEIIREKVLAATRQEVPHATAVSIESWEEQEDGLTRIGATIYVEKSGQRAILIGSGGSFVRDIGTKARAEIEQLLGTRVHLELYVKVSTDWRMNPQILRELELTD